MKRTVVSCLMLGTLMLVLTGMPLQLLHIDLIKSAYAYIAYGENHDWDNIRGQDKELDKIRGQENDQHNIMGMGNKWDDRGQEGSGENNWYQFDDREKFRVKDDDCKDILNHEKDGHKNWGKNEDGDTFWSKHKHYDSDDGRCNNKVPEPTTLSLLGAGIAAVGIYSFIRRRNSK